MATSPKRLVPGGTPSGRSKVPAGVWWVVGLWLAVGVFGLLDRVEVSLQAEEIDSGRSDSSPPLSPTREEWLQLIDERLEWHQQQGLLEGLPAETTRSDPSLVDQGEAAFFRSCTACHDAERSLAKSKSYAGWLATVRRMAAKDGAEVPSSDVEPIAAYLASLNQANADEQPGEDGAVAQTALNATISSVWRGSNGEATLENPDFFADVWAGAEWRPKGPLTARITACTSCHSDRNESSGFSLELLEASATLDLTSVLCGCCDSACDHRALAEAKLKSGRFVVPFGAFAVMSHPGIYRTVTNPLMFNMGRRVGPLGPLQPVIPMPYADEGVNLNADIALTPCWNATLDVYAVNGLQGTTPALFNDSRSYTDNNREPAVGARATIGNGPIRLGASLMTGNLADDGNPLVDYKLAGADVTARLDELLRFYFEYAIREDASTFVPRDTNYVYGIVAELEGRLLPKIGLLLRYDTLEHRHSFFGNDSLERFTWGLNLAMPGGSRMAINHEHWIFADSSDIDVIGVRWTSAF